MEGLGKPAMGWTGYTWGQTDRQTDKALLTRGGRPHLPSADPHPNTQAPYRWGRRGPGRARRSLRLQSRSGAHLDGTTVDTRFPERAGLARLCASCQKPLFLRDCLEAAGESPHHSDLVTRMKPRRLTGPSSRWLLALVPPWSCKDCCVTSGKSLTHSEL